jgi:hypothetical protein
MLPIQIPQFAPEQWRSLEKQLIAIAAEETLELDPPDRTVKKILAAVQYSAKANRWQEVFNMLRDRGIISLKAETTLLQLLAAQKMAYVLAIAPKQEKPKPAKVNKPRRLRSNPNPLITFCLIKSVFSWIAAIVKEHKLTPIYFQLTYTNEHGYRKLRSKIKMGVTVRKMLILARKQYKKRKGKGLSTLATGKILNETFAKILTDKWQDVSTLYEKFCKITAIPMARSRFDDRLEYRAKKGEIFKHKPVGSNCAFYSLNPNASSFEDEWMDLNRAYAIAVSNGYTAAINTFRCKANKTDMTKEGILRYYRRLGLEYRFEIPEGENRFFKWRLIN